MLLFAREQEMYGKMGKRDLCRKMCIVAAVAAFGFLWLWGVGVTDDAGLYETLLCLAVFLVSLIRYEKLKKRIMPVTGCFLRLEEEWLAVRQPGKDGQYEECRIFLPEIGLLIPGSSLDPPSFFLVLENDAQKSRIGVKERKTRQIFCVQGEWYGQEEFVALYQCFFQKLPDRLQKTAGDIPSGRKRMRVDFYQIFLWILPALFLLPVILEF